MKLLGIINGVKIYTPKAKPQESLDLAYIPESILQKIKTYAQKVKKEEKRIKSSLLKFALDEIPEKKYILKEYDLRLFEQKCKTIKKATYNKRIIPDEKYLQYLLQLCTKKQLKNFCKEYLITNYSKFKKEDLIEHILINLTESEKESFILRYELPILSEEIKEAIKILTNQSNEKGKVIRLDPERRDIEMNFTAERYTTSTYLSLQQKELHDPFRDCDCIRGSLGGFCRHLWVCLAIMIFKGIIPLEEWSLTKIPQNFLSLLKKMGTEAQSKKNLSQVNK